MKMKKIKSMLIMVVAMYVFVSGASIFGGNISLASVIPTVGPSLPDSTQADQLVRNFGGALSMIGYAIAIGMTVFIGIKYVIASADEKASLKGMMVKVVVGSVIIAAASTIVMVVNGVLTL